MTLWLRNNTEFTDDQSECLSTCMTDEIEQIRMTTTELEQIRDEFPSHLCVLTKTRCTTNRNF